MVPAAETFSADGAEEHATFGFASASYDCASFEIIGDSFVIFVCVLQFFLELMELDIFLVVRSFESLTTGQLLPLAVVECAFLVRLDMDFESLLTRESLVAVSANELFWLFRVVTGRFNFDGRRAGGHVISGPSLSDNRRGARDLWTPGTGK